MSFVKTGDSELVKLSIIEKGKEIVISKTSSTCSKCGLSNDKCKCKKNEVKKAK